jgi:hypothetical protein
MSNITKTQLTLTFAKGKLKVVQSETERLGDNTVQTTKDNNVYLVGGVEQEHVTMMKKSVLRQVAQFLGNSNGELEQEFKESVKAEFGTDDYSVSDLNDLDDEE